MLDKQLLIDLKEYVERHTVFVSFMRVNCDMKEGPICLNYESLPCETDELIEIDELIETDELIEFVNNNRRQTFNQILFGFIDKKGVADSDIYKKAGIDRRHFSKIRKPGYRIGKPTAVALALALELDEDETEELLHAAGYSLSRNDTFDLIIQFFLKRKIYDIYTINLALDNFSLKPLSVDL
jgi:hypothetical protein